MHPTQFVQIIDPSKSQPTPNAFFFHPIPSYPNTFVVCNASPFQLVSNHVQNFSQFVEKRPNLQYPFNAGPILSSPFYFPSPYVSENVEKNKPFEQIMCTFMQAFPERSSSTFK
jgi:hypothetical protein